jgi:basic membrane lipoprotein Med (substrate-binding protein (PBP1-ABC) superfamily)
MTDSHRRMRRTLAAITRFLASKTRNQRISLALAAPAIALVAVVVVVVLSSNDTPEPQRVVYSNVSQNFKVCLLSGDHDTAEAERVWPAVQQATTHAAINAQHVVATGQTADQLLPYLNSLIAMKCGLIITTGADLSAAAATAAQAHPQQHFITTTPTKRLPNLGALPAAAAVVTTTVVNAAHGKYPVPA